MNQLWWYTARASGIVGWALLAAGVLWGLALSTRALGSRPRPNWLLDMHRFLGAAAVVFTGIHVGSLVADDYVHFGLTEVLVPLASRWHPVAVAWGIVAFYLLLAVEVTSLLRRHLSRRLWRLTHLASFPLFTVATIHLLSAGTDRRNLPLRLTVLAVAAAVAALTLRRLAAPRPAAPTAKGTARERAVPVPAGAGPVATARTAPAAPPRGAAAPATGAARSGPRPRPPRNPSGWDGPVAWPSAPPVVEPARPPVTSPPSSPPSSPNAPPGARSARRGAEVPVARAGAPVRRTRPAVGGGPRPGLQGSLRDERRRE